METTTETSQANRELTATEIKITLAQIEDRLIRFVRAATEEMSHRDYEVGDESPEAIAADELKEKERIKKIREKHSIPDGVYLMGGCAINDKDIAPFMQFAKWWVKGQWTDEIANLFLFHYCEIVEVDFYWVLMDDPANYCGLGIEGFIDENNEEWRNECGYIRLEPELKRIGMRSPKKAIINFELYIGHGWHKNN